EDVEPVRVGKADVGENEVVVAAAETLVRLGGASGGVEAVAVALEDEDEGHAHQPVVLDEQDPRVVHGRDGTQGPRQREKGGAKRRPASGGSGGLCDIAHSCGIWR